MQHINQVNHSSIRTLLAVAICFLATSTGPLFAQNDPGQDPVARLDVSLVFATNGDASLAGEKAKVLDEAFAKRLRSEKKLAFKDYRFLGNDVQPVLRSYENWVAPLKPSEDILLSFEPEGSWEDGSLRIDLELWQSRKKILKANPTLKTSMPLYILGPEWRGGRIIISVTLLTLK